MQLLSILLHITLVFTAVRGQIGQVIEEFERYDTMFDDGSILIANTACAGQPRLDGYTTFADIPTFAQDHRIGGVADINYCGRCVRVDYNGTTDYVVLVDATPAISWEAASHLTGLTESEYPAEGVHLIATVVNQTFCSMTEPVLHLENLILSRQAKRKDILDRNLKKQRYQKDCGFFFTWPRHELKEVLPGELQLKHIAHQTQNYEVPTACCLLVLVKQQ
ncbi:hypothetical protein BDQ17DRAFT_1322197 [Cyathus striatus]|nr:hypothetical protein BDQ17DRAFT_1322197 [Cyathus striatus]